MAVWPNGKALDYDNNAEHACCYQEIPGSTPGTVIFGFLDCWIYS